MGGPWGSIGASEDGGGAAGGLEAGEAWKEEGDCQGAATMKGENRWAEEFLVNQAIVQNLLMNNAPIGVSLLFVLAFGYHKDDLVCALLQRPIVASILPFCFEAVIHTAFAQKRQGLVYLLHLRSHC